MDEPIPSTPQPDPSVTPVSSSPVPPVLIKKPVNPLVFVILGILILTLAGGGYYLANKTINPPGACTMEAKLCPDGSSVGRAGPNCEFALCPNTSLKTYTNSTYNFSFQYPNSLTINNFYDQSTGLPNKNVLFGFNFENQKGQTLDTFTIFDSKLLTINKWIEANKNIVLPEDLSTMTQVTISSLVVWKIPYAYGTFYVFSDNQNRVYLLGAADSKTADQILSTFKFIDKNSINDTTSWKMYSNSTLGFSVRYPTDWNLLTESPPTLSFTSVENFISHRTTITMNRYSVSELPRGYTDVNAWFRDLQTKNEKAITPHDGFSYGPGSDTPYKWYMYYSLDSVKTTRIATYPAITSSNTGTGLLYVVIPHGDYVYEIILNPIKAFDDTLTSQVLSTLTFIQ